MFHFSVVSSMSHKVPNGKKVNRRKKSVGEANMHNVKVKKLRTRRFNFF